MSRASEIAELLAERLGAIDGTGAFQTAIGTNVFRGKRAVAEEQTPCTVLFEGEDKPKDETQLATEIEQQYGIEGTMLVEDEDNPNDTAHKIIADIKRAIFLVKDPARMPMGKTYKGIKYRGRSIGVREDGSKYISAIVMIAVTYAEDLSNP